MYDPDSLRFSHAAFILIVAALVMSFAFRVGVPSFIRASSPAVRVEHSPRPTPIPAQIP